MPPSRWRAEAPKRRGRSPPLGGSGPCKRPHAQRQDGSPERRYFGEVLLHAVLPLQNLSCHHPTRNGYLSYPASLEGNREFKRSLEAGIMCPAASFAMSRAFGTRPTEGFYEWAHEWINLRATLDELFVGRCKHRKCRRNLTNYDPPHYCTMGD